MKTHQRLKIVQYLINCKSLSDFYRPDIYKQQLGRQKGLHKEFRDTRYSEVRKKEIALVCKNQCSNLIKQKLRRKACVPQRNYQEVSFKSQQVHHTKFHLPHPRWNTQHIFVKVLIKLKRWLTQQVPECFLCTAK